MLTYTSIKLYIAENKSILKSFGRIALIKNEKLKKDFKTTTYTLCILYQLIMLA